MTSPPCPTRPPPPTRRDRVASRAWQTVRVAGFVVGCIRPWDSLGELALVRVVDGHRHQLRRPPAWAIAIEALEAAREAGAEQVVVLDRAEGIEWTSWLHDFDERGFEIDHGFGRQVALGLDHWSHRPIATEGERPNNKPGGNRAQTPTRLENIGATE